MVRAEVSLASKFGFYNKTAIGDIYSQNKRCQKIQVDEILQKTFHNYKTPSRYGMVCAVAVIICRLPFQFQQQIDFYDTLAKDYDVFFITDSKFQTT